MNARDTWKLVQQKQDELRSLTEQNWQNGEWELAALGERVLRTTTDAREAASSMRTALVKYQVQCARYDQAHGA